MRPSLALTLLVLATPALAANQVVRFSTPLGPFDVELCETVSAVCPGDAPATVSNFLRYVDEDRYPPTGFIHRRGINLSPEVIQGGGFWSDPSTDPPVLRTTPTFPAIPLEIDPALSNVRGSIAMARSAGLNTATSQWYVNFADNTSLDGSYAVFGHVVQGLDVVDAIAAVPVYSFAAPFGELPLIGWPGGMASVVPHFVYVSSVERVPEPRGGAAAALAALAALVRRRR